MRKLKNITIKNGTVDEFMKKVKHVMRAADNNEIIEPTYHTLVFEDPREMLQFLSEEKINLINRIRKHPDSITNIAKAIGRNRSAVSRDIHQLEKFGLVKTYVEIPPGHRRHQIVEAVAAKLKLEAYI